MIPVVVVVMMAAVGSTQSVRSQRRKILTKVQPKGACQSTNEKRKGNRQQQQQFVPHTPIYTDKPTHIYSIYQNYNFTAKRQLMSSTTPTATTSPSDIAQCTQDAVFVKSEKVPDDTPVVKGEDFSTGAHLDEMVQKMLTTGFQATNVALAIEVINKMVSTLYCSQDDDGLFRDAYIQPPRSRGD